MAAGTFAARAKGVRSMKKVRPQMQMKALSVLIVEHKHCEAGEHGGQWSAQCLEYDMATQADSLAGLYYQIERMIVGHIVVSVELGMEPFKGLSPAPKRFFKLYDDAKLRLHGDPSPFSLPSFQGRPIPELRVMEQVC